MKNKKCPRCQRMLPVTAYNTRMRNGKKSPCSYCKDCNKARLKDHYYAKPQYYKDKKKRYTEQYREWFKSIKTELKCNRCNEDHIACLDFHHTDPSIKEYNIGKMISALIPKHIVLAEIEKCEVLCANCHRKEHYKAA